MIWIWKKIQLIKTATMISKIGMKNIYRNFKEYIQTTVDLIVDVLFNFLQIYFNQSRNPTFFYCFGENWIWIVISFETGLGRWMMVVAVISVDAYPFLAFSDLTCHLDDATIGVFWLHCAAW